MMRVTAAKYVSKSRRKDAHLSSASGKISSANSLSLQDFSPQRSKQLGSRFTKNSTNISHAPVPLETCPCIGSPARPEVHSILSSQPGNCLSAHFLPFACRAVSRTDRNSSADANARPFSHPGTDPSAPVAVASRQSSSAIHAGPDSASRRHDAASAASDADAHPSARCKDTHKRFKPSDSCADA